MICILGEKMAHKKEQRYICLNLVTFIVLIIYGYQLGQVDISLVKTLTSFLFFGGGGVSYQHSRRK